MQVGDYRRTTSTVLPHLRDWVVAAGAERGFYAIRPSAAGHSVNALGSSPQTRVKIAAINNYYATQHTRLPM